MSILSLNCSQQLAEIAELSKENREVTESLKHIITEYRSELWYWSKFAEEVHRQLTTCLDAFLDQVM